MRGRLLIRARERRAAAHGIRLKRRCYPYSRRIRMLLTRVVAVCLNGWGEDISNALFRSDRFRGSVGSVGGDKQGDPDKNDRAGSYDHQTTRNVHGPLPICRGGRGVPRAGRAEGSPVATRHHTRPPRLVYRRYVASDKPNPKVRFQGPSITQGARRRRERSTMPCRYADAASDRGVAEAGGILQNHQLPG